MARRGAVASEQAERLTKQDWIEAALHEIAQGGVGAARVEVLARKMGVTKGSFYWHFKDRDALLVEMLRHWQQQLTAAIGRFVRERIDDPREALAFLFRLATADREDVPGGSAELALREWAKVSEVARRALSEVDAERLSIMSDLYMKLGLTRAKASAAALLALSHIIGVNVIYREAGRQALRSQQDACIDLLLALPDVAKAR